MCELLSSSLRRTWDEDWFSRGPKRIISRHLAPTAYQLCTASLSCEVPVPQPGGTDWKGINPIIVLLPGTVVGHLIHMGWPDNQPNMGEQNTKNDYLGFQESLGFGSASCSLLQQVLSAAFHFPLLSRTLNPLLTSLFLLLFIDGIYNPATMPVPFKPHKTQPTTWEWLAHPTGFFHRSCTDQNFLLWKVTRVGGRGLIKNREESRSC